MDIIDIKPKPVGITDATFLYDNGDTAKINYKKPIPLKPVNGDKPIPMKPG